ncbi:DUF1972 domain-containing protein [Citrobacter freundii]|uniref:DUF1972 domain-containing protein n=1 Tax=Citrobacter freundii TaxID=546 RepID=UPI0015EAAF1A|nr:DUF1972 domain-containing protein [Citrobacter freundii]QLY60537.1 DUF1972 domain-containing protein [Citrobacter freundii]
MKKIHIIGTVGVPACYGGFETLVDNLLDDERFDITVYCSSKTYKNKKVEKYKGANLVYVPLNANGIQSVAYDVYSMFFAATKKADIILVLGVSGCFFLPVLRKISHAKIVTNIDGLEWRRDKWNSLAKSFLKKSEELAVKFSDVVISDNKAIADYVKNEYAFDSQVIAYGGDHAITKEITFDDKDYAFTVCRIEPENNIAMILGAFSVVNKKLVIVGNWNNSSYGQELRKKYNSCKNIEMLDPIYDTPKLAELRAFCSCYIHGHSAGGTNPSLVEMMHFGKSIICFDCSYNRETTDHKAIYFQDEHSLSEIMKSAKHFGENKDMLEIAREKYTWDKIREQYYNIFEL